MVDRQIMRILQRRPCEQTKRICKLGEISRNVARSEARALLMARLVEQILLRSIPKEKLTGCNIATTNNASSSNKSNSYRNK
jgi:hypothetical protein